MGTEDSDRVGHMSSDQVLMGLNQLWLQLGKFELGETTTGGSFLSTVFHVVEIAFLSEFQPISFREKRIKKF